MEMEEHAEEYEASLKRVQESLQAYPELEIKILPGSTHTAELAAQALGTTPGQIAKTLCFLADGTAPFFCVYFLVAAGNNQNRLAIG